MKQLVKILMVLGVASLCSACSDVSPRQRGALALPQMAYVIDGQEFALRQHTSYSKESQAGGYGGGGGGCGCN